MPAKYLSIMCSIIYQSTWNLNIFPLSFIVCVVVHQHVSNLCIAQRRVIEIEKNWKIVKIFILHTLHNWNVSLILGVFTPHFMLMELFPINILHIAYVTFIVFIIFGCVCRHSYGKFKMHEFSKKNCWIWIGEEADFENYFNPSVSLNIPQT